MIIILNIVNTKNILSQETFFKNIIPNPNALFRDFDYIYKLFENIFKSISDLKIIKNDNLNNSLYNYLIQASSFLK